MLRLGAELARPPSVPPACPSRRRPQRAPQRSRPTGWTTICRSVKSGRSGGVIAAVGHQAPPYCYQLPRVVIRDHVGWIGRVTLEARLEAQIAAGTRQPRDSAWICPCVRPAAYMPKKRKPRRGKAGLSEDGCGEISGGDVNRRVEENVARACFRGISSENIFVSSFAAETRPAFRHLWQQSGLNSVPVQICSCYVLGEAAER